MFKPKTPQFEAWGLSLSKSVFSSAKWASVLSRAALGGPRAHSGRAARPGPHPPTRVSHRDSQEGFLDLRNLEPYSSHTAARPSGGRGGCSDLPRVQLHHGSLPSTCRSHQTFLQLCQVLTANLVVTLRPRMQEGGQAGGAVNRGVSFIISCFNFHSAQILHPA